MTTPASPAPTKTCPQCAETIQAAAHICPYCRSRVDGGNAQALLGGIVLVIAAIGAWQFFSQSRDEIVMTLIVMGVLGALLAVVVGLFKVPALLRRRRASQR